MDWRLSMWNAWIFAVNGEGWVVKLPLLLAVVFFIVLEMIEIVYHSYASIRNIKKQEKSIKHTHIHWNVTKWNIFGSYNTAPASTAQNLFAVMKKKPSDFCAIHHSIRLNALHTLMANASCTILQQSSLFIFPPNSVHLCLYWLCLFVV